MRYRYQGIRSGRNALMRPTARVGTLVVAAALSLLPSVAIAQHHPGSAPADGTSYLPRLGDLMTLAQIRHAKLWFAVAAGNWPLADHELGGLQDGFADIAKLYPTVEGVAVGPVVVALQERELTALAA